MTTLGSVKRRIQYPSTGLNFTVSLCPKFSSFVSVFPEASRLYDLSSYEKVRALSPDVRASIKKCDVSPIFPCGRILDHALMLVELYLSPFMSSDAGFDQRSEFNLSTSAGFVYAQKGLPKKTQAMNSSVFKDLYSRDDFIPIAVISDKEEFLPNEDLNRNKVRTIFVDPLDKLAKTKFLFDKQNKSLVDSSSHSWIKYGMSKQYSGFHKFVKQLEPFTLRDQSDVSGYDRTAFLYYVYYIRWRLLNLHVKRHESFWYVVFHSIFPTCLDPDGIVFMRQTGNNSGGNNTAADNSILHLIVLFYFLIKTYYKRFHKLLSLDSLLNNAYFGIYSDDQLGGVFMDFFGWCSVEDYERDKVEAYADWGLVIKPSASFISLGPGRLDSKHEFLGSYCFYDQHLEIYLPFPRIGKICSSITRLGLTVLDESQFFEKVLALTFLAFPCSEVFKILVHYLEYIFSNSKDQTTLRHILLVNDLDFMRDSFLQLHTGWECGDRHSGPLFFPQFTFFSSDGGGGFKNTMSRFAVNEKLIKLLENRTDLDSDSANYLVMFCDPFFDGQVKHLNGLPDAKTGKSMTSVITQELQISKPSSLPAGNWSMHIQNNPWTSDPNVPGFVPATGSDFYGNYAQFPVAPRNPLSRWPSVSVWRGADGNLLGPFQADAANNVQAIGVGMPDNYTKGVGRLIGWAMEYYDTTPPLYRGGSVRCYRQPTNSFETKSTIVYAAPNLGPVTQNGAASAILIRRPPESPQEANLLAGTIGWKAEDGFYMVMSPIEAELPAKTVDDSQPVMFPGDFSAGIRNFAVAADVITGAVANAPSAPNQKVLSPGTIWNLVPWNMSGAIFAGLNEQHTGLLRVRYIYERFPSPDEADFSLAAQPCAAYNSKVFEIIAKMLAEMPIGMVVSSNSLGEWLYTALSWVFPSLKKGLHAMTAPEPEKSSQETKEIVRLSKAVEQMAKRPAVIKTVAAPRPAGQPRPPRPPNAPSRVRRKKKPSSAASGQ